MGTPFGVRSWLWVMAHINCLYGLTFAKRSGRMWVTPWSYPWKNGSNNENDKLWQNPRPIGSYRASTPLLVRCSRHGTRILDNIGGIVL
jgi:hypothetical protein